MSGYAYSASHMNYNQVQFLLRSLKLCRRLSGLAFLIQRMKEAFSLHRGKPRDSGQITELVCAHRIGEEGRTTDFISYLSCKDHPEVGGMFSVRRIHDIPNDVIIYAIGSRLDMFEKSATSTYGVK